MKKSKKIVILLFTLSIIIFILSFTISLALNKKYAVDEIVFTKTNTGLLGIQKIIEADYLWMMYLNIFYALMLIILAIAFILVKRKM